MNDSDELEGLLSVLEDIAETSAVYGDEQQRTVSRISYAKKFVRQLLNEAIKRGFYAGQAMAGVELYDCHKNWKKWDNK